MDLCKRINLKPKTTFSKVKLGIQKKLQVYVKFKMKKINSLKKLKKKKKKKKGQIKKKKKKNLKKKKKKK